MDLVSKIEALFMRRGALEYSAERREPVTALAHALQCAQLAEWAHADESLVMAALLHDLGHWPFCHPIEDLHLPQVPHHELFANSFLLEGEIADALRDDWGVSPRDVVSLLSERPRDAARKILASMLSGPIDVDKMDYLLRDSLFCGVRYGLDRGVRASARRIPLTSGS